MSEAARDWIICKPELGMKAYADVLTDELDSLGVPYDLERQVSRRVYQWLKEQEPAHLDLAVISLTEAGKEIPKLLQEQLADAALARLKGRPSRKAPMTRLQKEGCKWTELRWMVLLIVYCGVSKPNAAKMSAAKAWEMFGSELCMRASSLEKEYEKFKKSKDWSVLNEDTLSRRTPSWTKEQQEDFLSNFKSVNEIPDYQNGQRR